MARPSPVFCLFRQSSTRYHCGERQLFTLCRARIFRLATPALCSCAELPERAAAAIDLLLALGHTSGADTLLGFWLGQQLLQGKP